MTLELNDWLALWAVLGGCLLLVQSKFGRATGLVTAYFIQLAALHWIAATIYLVPGYTNLNLDDVVSGLRISTYGLLGFTIGVAYVGRRITRLQTPDDGDGNATPLVDNSRLYLYAAVGVASYVLLGRFGRVATVSAIIAAGSGFIVVALALACWNQAAQGRNARLLALLALTGVLPFVTIAIQGFMGYGLAAAAVVFAYVASFYRISWRTVAVGLVGLYLGLSLYVTYMRDREEIRRVVWGTSAQTSDRLSSITDTFTNFELFDPSNQEHLWRIDIRLNQNYMVGVAEGRLSQHLVSFADGETVIDALWALIPRALWPDKPQLAGSGDLVTRFTGIRFAEGTSVGIGQVMEWYVNFGLVGVFLGFLGFGIALAWIDHMAYARRAAGDWSGFAQWFLPGVAMLQIGGSLVEVTASVAAAVIVATLVARVAPGERRSRATMAHEWPDERHARQAPATMVRRARPGEHTT